jgi:type II secretory pathway pseudopilin PulG
MVELLVVVSLMTTLAAVGVPLMLRGMAAARVTSAARHLTGRLRLARMEAVKRSRTVAVRFEPRGDSYAYTLFVDGNGNGVRSADIAARIDLPMSTPERIEDGFPGVRFAIVPGIRAIEPGEALDPGDPVRFGSTDSVSFTAHGTATPGTVYLLGDQAWQYAVRVLGTTGRTRVMRYQFAEGQWSTE